MFPVFRSLSLRYLRLRWDRAALVVLSIALGVATLVSTLILNQCLEEAAHDTMTPIPTAELYAMNGESGVFLAVADDLKRANIPGVDIIIPMIFEQIGLIDPSNRKEQVAILVAADLKELVGLKDEGKKAIDTRILDFDLARSGKGIFISQFWYDQRQANGIPDSAPVKLTYAEREIEFPLAGVLKIDPDGPAARIERTLVAMNLQQALKLVKYQQYPSAAGFIARRMSPAVDAMKGDRVSRIDIHIKPGTNLEQVKSAAQAVVGNRAEVKTLEQQKRSTDDAISGIQISLKLCSAGALVVGLFLVYNAMSVSVAERRPDIGVLRSIGATRFQVARLFAGEAVLLGIAGALLGIPLGNFLATTAIGLISEDLNAMFLNPEIEPTKLSSTTMAIALAAGVLTALLAALAPALQAANDEPADAVRRAPSARNRIFYYLHRSACTLAIVGGFAMILFRHHLPGQRTGSLLGLSFILTGMFLAMPILVGLMARSLQPVFRLLLGVEARLAADNLVRSPARTGVVIGALAAGVSLMFQTVGIGRSSKEPINEWIDQVIQADAFIFSGSLASANSSNSRMSPSVGDAIEKVDGVERVVGLRFLRPEYQGKLICLVAIDADDYMLGTRSRLPHGLPKLETFGKLSSGNFTVVSDNFAAKFEMKEGDVITLSRPQGGPIDLTIVGVGQDYTWSQGTIFMDRKRYVEAFGDDYVDIYHAYFKPGTDEQKRATRQALEAAMAPLKLVVEDKKYIREFLAGVIDKLYLLAKLQQVTVAVVAALGVVTALLISVLQRRRELGLLRAVGAAQPQVLKTVLAEAFLMGIIGTFLGIVLGLPMEWYLLHIVLFEESGFWFEMIVPWIEALGIAAIAISVATIAGLLPAIHAVRLRITEAIAYE